MRTIIIFIAALFLAASVYAQAPEKMSYQAVIRDASNNLVSSSPIGMQISILQGSPTGTAVYVETQVPTSNTNGLVTIEVGNGTVVSGSMSTIDWSAGPYFIKTESDPNGGSTYTISGTSQLMSVPYALYAKTAGTVISGGSSNWTLNGTDIYKNNSGNVGIGILAPKHDLAVSDTLPVIAVGNFGGFNSEESGRLVFSEDLQFNGDCGLMFQYNGANNNLFLLGGCTAFNDTLARFNRSGQSNIRQLRIGNNVLSNPSSPLSVTGNSDFDGNMTITGNLNVSGVISKGSGTFKIDHPLDPANKYLVHSFVESPEMMNVYSGNISTDANGYATVTMPDYFEAANKDFRYQLTVIGSFAQAIIKEKVSNNRFVIQTNTPNVEVSWQVTAVRSDKFANNNRVIPEQVKELKGSYIHPELYGVDPSNSEAAQRAKAVVVPVNNNDLDR